MISRYMVLVASEQKLLMMRPYQIYAVKAIVDCIHQNCGNGYIWHTTGSGKTLTSFNASTLLKDNPDIGNVFLSLIVKTLIAKRGKSLTGFKKDVSRKTQTPKRSLEGFCRITLPIKSSSRRFRNWVLRWMAPISAIIRNSWSHYATSA